MASRTADGVTALVMELVEGEDAGAADRARTDSARRGAADREADRRGARSGARAGDHPSRSEAREHQGHARRHGEGAGLRPREARALGSRRPAPADVTAVADDHVARDDDRRGRDPRHRRLHGAGASEGTRGGQAQRHLGVRVRAVRDADRQASVRR